MRNLFRGLFAALALCAAAASAQDAPQWQSGKHYNTVREPTRPADPARIEVVEFFWYGCQHCYALDPVLDQWRRVKPADVDFVQVPNSLGRPVGIVHSKVFYTEQKLNVLDKMHRRFFDGIHRERKNLQTQEQAQEFFTRELGLLPDVFNNTFTSFEIDGRVRKAEALAAQYAVSSVPTMVVGGTYYTQAAMAGSFDKLVQVVNFLVDKVRRERAGK